MESQPRLVPSWSGCMACSCSMHAADTSCCWPASIPLRQQCALTPCMPCWKAVQPGYLLKARVVSAVIGVYHRGIAGLASRHDNRAKLEPACVEGFHHGASAALVGLRQPRRTHLPAAIYRSRLRLRLRGGGERRGGLRERGRRYVSRSLLSRSFQIPGSSSRVDLVSFFFPLLASQVTLIRAPLNLHTEETSCTTCARR